MGPKTLDELLEVVPGLRRARSLSADVLRQLLDRRARECTWCGTVVAARRTTWCSDACVTAFQHRCTPQIYHKVVISRDRWICQLCGADTKAQEQEFRKVWELTKGLKLSAVHRNSGEYEKLARQFCYGRGRWREVDHIVAVQDGGGLTGLENLRLVCGKCHSSRTSQQAGTRSQQRKAGEGGNGG